MIRFQGYQEVPLLTTPVILCVSDDKLDAAEAAHYTSKPDGKRIPR